MKFCLCVTGFTGAGKTTLVRQLGMMGWRTFHTGDIFRKYIAEIPEDADPVAPEFADDIIHSALVRLATQVVEAPGIGLLAVECVPRAVRSIEWVTQLRDMGFVVHVVMLSARKPLRENRVESRDITDAGRLNIDRRKILAEELTDVFFEIRTGLEDEGISCSFQDTDEWQYILDSFSTAHSIDRMMNCALNFYGEKVDYQTEPNVIRMAARAQEELREAMDAVTNGGNVKTELVDALWFLLAAFRAAGVDNGRDLVRHFLAKAAINQHRLDSSTHMDING